MGETGERELELAALDPPPALLPEEYAAALDIALSERPELARARAARDRAERGVDEARAGYLPRADLFARLYGDTPDGLDFGRGNWIAGVALTWGVYAGGARGAGVDQARAGLREMLEADRAATLAVQLDVKRAWLRRDEARARQDVAGAAVGQAEESLRLVRDQYEGGAATVTRYLEAELMATQARMRATQARYDLRKAEAELERALGRHRERVEDEG
jgi:outer membrane protein TolC